MTSARDQRRLMAELRADPERVREVVGRSRTLADAAAELGISLRSLHKLILPF